MKVNLKLVMVLCALMVSAQAALSLKQARKDGKICECPNGMVAAVADKCKGADELKLVRGIVAATNSTRRGHIIKIAKKDGVSAEKAGKVIADKMRKKYPGSACRGTRCPKI